MPKVVKELSALAVSKILDPGYHAVGGVAGLYLQVLESSARTWIYRTTIGGKRREMGLGSYSAYSLAQARAKALEARETIDKGIDPIDARRAAKSRLRAELAKAITFQEAATSYIATHEHGWKNAKHAAQWTSTLETYAYPTIGKLLVRDVDDAHVMEILTPIWTTKTETASRLRGRIEKVLDWAIASQYREGPNPARWKGNLDVRLAQPSKVAKVDHHPALHYDDIGEFMVELRQIDGFGARALEFAILTATRSGEVRGATWQEINLDKALWIIPKGRMKREREHHVPLSPDAVKLLRALPKLADSPYVFPGTKGEMSDATMAAVIKRINAARKGVGKHVWTDPQLGKEVVPHGFRSTFRDWGGEVSNFPPEVCEHALAHKLKDKAEAAYQRGCLFDKRRALMDAWASYCARVKVRSESSNVVTINAQA